VAGIAAAATNNGIGIAGVSWGARIMPVKVLGATGEGLLSTVAAGIEWAVNNGAQVINMSLGGRGTPPSALGDAIAYAHAQGVVCIAAMGNSGDSSVYYPAALEHVIAVAATGPADLRASYSSYGPHCDLAAPGGDDSGGNVGDRVYSTYPSSSYAWMQGTSMATPHVAGAAALLLTVAPDLSPDMVRVLLQTSAVDKGALGRDPYYGNGRMDIAATLGKTELLIAPSDPRVDEQWALAVANVPEAWAVEDALSIGASDVVTVAVLSTGVDATHPELAGRLLPAYDARPDADNPVDTIGRGTALAGIIAANSDNGAGIAGMARAASVRVLPIRVTADSGAVRTDALAAGIAYASAQSAQIILIDGSGTISQNQAVDAALANAHAQGALIIAGTGDSGAATVGYPASSPHVLAISATTWDDTLAPTSRYGTGVALAAPGGTTAGQPSGVLVLNTGGGYTTRASTAVAAAHVTGTAAMMLARQPAARPAMQLTTTRLRMLLQAGARDLGAPGHDAFYGAGRLDVERSLWLATHIEPQLVLPLVARNW
jgi:subtilisin family serine protease